MPTCRAQWFFSKHRAKSQRERSIYFQDKKWEAEDFWQRVEIESLMEVEELFPYLFYPNISMHILYTVRLTFSMMLTRRICITIESFFSWQSIPLLSWPLMVWFRLILQREIRCKSLLRDNTHSLFFKTSKQKDIVNISAQDNTRLPFNIDFINFNFTVISWGLSKQGRYVSGV